jgi:hypothetical protein
MKKRIFALAGVCLLALAACDNSPGYQPDPNAPSAPADECGPGPQPNGEPCR